MLRELGNLLKVQWYGRVSVDGTFARPPIGSEYEPYQPDGSAKDSSPGTRGDADRQSAKREDRITLSPAGRLIAKLLAPDFADAPAMELSSATPLFDANPEPLMVAEKLVRIFSGSGLFYESHLAKWVAGNYDFAQIQIESSSRIKPIVAPPSIANVETPVESNTDFLRMIRQQLDALATGQIGWNGMVAIGIPGTIKISRAVRNTLSTHGERWQTLLGLACPTLGDIEVTMLLEGNMLSVRIAASTHLHSDLTRESAAIKTAFRARRIALVELIVADGPAREPMSEDPLTTTSQSMRKSQAADDPRHAAARAYSDLDGGQAATASTNGASAEEIIRRAKEAGVFVHESPELVGLLAHLDLDERIPPALYLAVAEVLAWIRAVECMPRQHQGPHPAPSTRFPEESRSRPPL